MIASACFLLAHPNPTNHSIEFIKHYGEQGVKCTVFTTEECVVAKLNGLPIKVELVDLSDKSKIADLADRVNTYALAVADISTPTWEAVYQKAKEANASTILATYYDNPERFVSTFYSGLAERMFHVSHMVLFSNANHARESVLNADRQVIDISGKESIGIGYYPMNVAAPMLEMRSEETKTALRKAFFKEHGIRGYGQEVATFTGGANPGYYKAFECFLDILEEALQRDNTPFSNKVYVLKQHPRAIKEGNQDAELLASRVEKLRTLCDSFHFVICSPNFTTPQMLSMSDIAIYHQTSMAPQFVCGGIPRVLKTGPKEDEDLLTRLDFPIAHDTDSFLSAITSPQKGGKKEELLKSLGVCEAWWSNLPKLPIED